MDSTNVLLMYENSQPNPIATQEKWLVSEKRRQLIADMNSCRLLIGQSAQMANEGRKRRERHLPLYRLVLVLLEARIYSRLLNHPEELQGY